MYFRYGGTCRDRVNDSVKVTLHQRDLADMQKKGVLIRNTVRKTCDDLVMWEMIITFASEKVKMRDMEEDFMVDVGPIVDKMQGIIKVIGVGGGGCNAVRNMYNEGVEGVTYAVLNMDSQSLSRSPVPVKIMHIAGSARIWYERLKVITLPRELVVWE